jgi:hypothetical protein
MELDMLKALSYDENPIPNTQTKPKTKKEIFIKSFQTTKTPCAHALMMMMFFLPLLLQDICQNRTRRRTADLSYPHLTTDKSAGGTADQCTTEAALAVRPDGAGMLRVVGIGIVARTRRRMLWVIVVAACTRRRMLRVVVITTRGRTLLGGVGIVVPGVLLLLLLLGVLAVLLLLPGVLTVLLWRVLLLRGNVLAVLWCGAGGVRVVCAGRRGVITPLLLWRRGTVAWWRVFRRGLGVGRVIVVRLLRLLLLVTAAVEIFCGHFWCGESGEGRRGEGCVLIGQPCWMDGSYRC